jgi:hypothetical protein
MDCDCCGVRLSPRDLDEGQHECEWCYAHCGEGQHNTECLFGNHEHDPDIAAKDDNRNA